MRAQALILISTLSAACGGKSQTPADRPMSAAEHLAAAEQSEKAADKLEKHPGDQPGADITPMMAGINEASTSGGEPLLRPRWSTSMELGQQYRMKAKRLRDEAAEHRQIAKGLTRAEERACAGLSQDDIDDGPFFHAHAVAGVEPVEQGGMLVGARIWFEPVPDLTAAWMQRSVDCAMARAAVLGYPRDYMPESPLMLPGIRVGVGQRGQHIEVTVHARDPDTAIEVLGRANRLLQRPAR